MADEYKSLLDELEKKQKPVSQQEKEPIKRWNHAKEGNKFSGKVVKVGESKYRNRTYRWMIVDGIFYENGEEVKGRRLVILPTVLRNWVEKNQVKVGDVIAVKCTGKSPKGYYEFIAVKK